MNSPELNGAKRLENLLGLVLLFLLLIGCFLVMRPFLSAAMWAAILGFTLWPVHRRMLGWLGGRRTLAACATTAALGLVLVVPFVLLGFSVADDVRALGTASRKWVESDANPPAWVRKLPLVGEKAETYWQEFAAEAAQLAQTLKQKSATNNMAASEDVAGVEAVPVATEKSPGSSRLVIAVGRLLLSAQSWLLKAGLAIGRGIIEVALSVFLVFFIFRDGAALAERMKYLVARIVGERGHHLIEVAGGTVRGVVYGILGTALVQGVMAAIGFAIAGVPGAALLGFLTFLLSALPVGPPLVWIPAMLWLFNQGSTGWGIFMAVWGVAVSSVDNVVKPWLISQGSDLPFVLIFFGVLGGALAFGVIGVFLGPTLLAVAYRLAQEWSGENSGKA
ncbi:MAG: AI-2E family transporter [Verrucomicrobia bacterium]|nr:MAG: AI-2E family transporter [Verrucomicrobiota bacterium]